MKPVDVAAKDEHLAGGQGSDVVGSGTGGRHGGGGIKTLLVLHDALAELMGKGKTFCKCYSHRLGDDNSYSDGCKFSSIKYNSSTCIRVRALGLADVHELRNEIRSDSHFNLSLRDLKGASSDKRMENSSSNVM